MVTPKQIFEQAMTPLPTDGGEFDLYAFSESSEDQMPHLVLVSPDMNPNEPVHVRIHSECITGDLFGSLRCDCGEQLKRSRELIHVHHGVLIYLRQEGRGIGIINKLKAYNLQDRGMDTVEANEALHLPIDGRQYDHAIRILQHFEIKKLRLITNNPDKLEAFDDSGIELVERVPINIPPNQVNQGYLSTKKDYFGHY